MPNIVPLTNTDLHELNARNDNARHIIDGCASAMPTLADVNIQTPWQGWVLCDYQRKRRSQIYLT